MPADDLDALLSEMEGRCEKATPGPWERRGVNLDGPLTVHVTQASGERLEYRPTLAYFRNSDRRHADIDFCADARTDLPRALAAVREAVEGWRRLRAISSDRCLCCGGDCCGFDADAADAALASIAARLRGEPER